MKSFNIAYFSPGWPINDYPNGIVSYVQNIATGFCEMKDIQTYILANQTNTDYISKEIIDLSKHDKNNIIKSITDKILYRLNTDYFKAKQFHYRRDNTVQRIINAIQSINDNINILEIEESFGLAEYIVQKTNIPVITRLHGPWFIQAPLLKLDNEFDYPLRVNVEGRAIQASAGISAPSQDVLDKVREFYNDPLPHARVIPNPAQSTPKELQWKLENQKKTSILVVGRFDLTKGGDLAIDTFRIIAQKNKDVELFFVGPDRNIVIEGVQYSFHDYLESFIPENEIKNRIHFLGHCGHQKISKLRQNTTVTIMTSRYETFSISLAEALSSGSPVVATNVGAISELITHNYNGLLAEPNSAESIAENVLVLLDDTERMLRLSANAIKDCKERFSPEVVAEKTIKFYHSVL